MRRDARGGKANWRRWVLACALGVLVVGAAALFAGTAFAAPPHGGGHGGHDGGHGHVSVTVGPVWWGPYWWWYPGPYGYYGPWYYDYPRTVVEEPRVYVEPQPETPPPPTEGYWYYCPTAREYYPNVQTCPEPWVKVPPRPE